MGNFLQREEEETDGLHQYWQNPGAHSRLMTSHEDLDRHVSETTLHLLSTRAPLVPSFETAMNLPMFDSDAYHKEALSMPEFAWSPFHGVTPQDFLTSLPSGLLEQPYTSDNAGYSSPTHGLQAEKATTDPCHARYIW